MYRSYNLGFYQKGGATKTVAQQWKEMTGLEWSEAKRLGLTDGSAEGNQNLIRNLNRNEGNLRLPSVGRGKYGDANKVPISSLQNERDIYHSKYDFMGFEHEEDPRIKEMAKVNANKKALEIGRKEAPKSNRNFLNKVADAVAYPGNIIYNGVKDRVNKLRDIDAGEVVGAFNPLYDAVRTFGGIEERKAVPKYNTVQKLKNRPAQTVAPIMIPIPVNVGAYKKYRDGGQVTIDELFGY